VHPLLPSLPFYDPSIKPRNRSLESHELMENPAGADKKVYCAEFSLHLHPRMEATIAMSLLQRADGFAQTHDIVPRTHRTIE
jgi:hypothetical protein